LSTNKRPISRTVAIYLDKHRGSDRRKQMVFASVSPERSVAGRPEEFRCDGISDNRRCDFRSID
jgi:hypothetical protein